MSVTDWLMRNNIHSSLAQSVERMTVNHDVAGSSPAGGAKNPRSSERGFFICAAGTTSFACFHASSFELMLNTITAHGTKNDVALCANDVLRNDVMALP